jgi:hypothetical protein
MELLPCVSHGLKDQTHGEWHVVAVRRLFYVCAGCFPDSVLRKLTSVCRRLRLVILPVVLRG